MFGKWKERKQETLRHRTIIINALNKTVETFTAHSEKAFSDVMSIGLRPVAEAVGLDRIAVYQLFGEEDTLGQTYVWAHGKTTQLDNELIMLPDNPAVARWVKILQKGECINDRVDKMPKDSAEFLSIFKVKSILFVPIFTHGKFWGIVTLEDQHSYRYFDKDYLDLLRSAAQLCAGALIRMNTTRDYNETLETLRRREQITDTLNMMAVNFLSQGEETGESFEDMMNMGIKFLVDTVDIDRLSVFRNIPEFDGLHTSQIYRWERGSGGTISILTDLKDITFASYAPRWEGLLASGEVINGPARLMPEYEMLKSFGIVSLFVAPVFIASSFWGFVLFEEHQVELYFENDIADMLRSAAFLCANTVLRTEMRREINETNAFNHTLIETAPTGFTVIDENLNVLDCNLYILKLFETTKDYYINHFAEFLPPYQDDGQKSDVKAISIIKRALKGEVVTSPWTHKSSTGKLIPSEVTLVRIKFRGKDAVLGYQYNLSNIKKMEQEVMDTNTLNRALIDFAPMGISVIDENFMVINCNDAALKMFETTREYFSEHFMEFSPEFQKDGSKSTEKAIEYTTKAIKGEFEFVTVEWMHQSSKGTPIPVEVTLTRTMHNGKYVALAYQYDLRNIKKMEQELAEAEGLARAITEGSPISYVLFDENLNPVDCNETTLELLECTDKQYFLDHYWDVFVPESQPDKNGSFGIASDIKNTLAIEDKSTFAWYQRTLKGELIPTENTMSKFTYRGKKFVVSFKYDMRNTQKLTEKLQEALHKATEASKAKGEFLSNMSHEMRTPMNAIIGMTSIGEKADDMERKDYAFNKIKEASSHLLGVINDVLDMSKIEANKLELSPIEFDFEQMLQKTVSVIHFRIDEKKQKFTVNLDSAIPRTIIGDNQRIAQVITNLLSNAVKFTPDEGHIHLDTHLVSEIDGTCTIEISVTDTGIGIAPEQHDRIFQSFQQAESSTTRKFGGTGLGLAISKNIVEFMGGKMWFESDIGKGSTFSFTFVAECGQGAKRGLLDPSLDASNVRILIVDDDRDVLEYLQEIVQRFGIKYCDTALSGEEALRLTQEKGVYNINIIDWKMPGIDGFELTSKLKAVGAASGTMIVIMISSADFSGMEKKAKESGVDKFVAKPLFPSSIADLISECLGFDTNQNKEIQLNIEGLFEDRHILLAEDVDINREIVTTLLEPTMLGIDCAENGKEAVRMFTENPDKYDLIVMDVQMPEMDGYEATRTIRALDNPKAKIIPIIAMTANVFKDDVERCLEAGMNSHIGKPIDFNEVISKLRNFLPRRN